MDTLWILNADETRGRIFTTNEFIGKLEEHIDLIHPEARLKEHALSHHTIGREKSNEITKGHGLNQKGALKEHHAEVFAKKVAQTIINADNQNQFKHLIIIAAPRFLGLLRKKLNANVLSKVFLEVNKELSHLTIHELKKHIEKLVS